MCLSIGNSPVHREGKWAISEDDYPFRTWPDYCHGAFSFFSSDVAFSLHSKARKTPFVWIDDAYITGVVRQFAGVSMYNNSYTLQSPKEFNQILDNLNLEEYSHRFNNNWYIYEPLYNQTSLALLWSKLMLKIGK